MESIKVLTGQHVTIEYKSATIVDRMLALLLDSFITSIYIVIILFIFFSMDFFNSDYENPLIILMIVLLLPALGYHFLFESLWSGQTPGKKVLNIKVTNEDGTATSVGGYFLRWLIRPVDTCFMCGVGAICILATAKHQRLGDLAAGTIVVKTQPQQQRIKEEYYSFNSSYQVRYPQVSKLTKGQIQFIMKTLEIPEKTNDYRENEAVVELAEKIKMMLNISVPGDSRSFLEDIVRDYHYYDSLGI